MISRLVARLAPIFGPNWCFRTGEKFYAAGEFREGVRLLGNAARRGHPGAQLQMGQLYLNGQGVPPSRTEAARWLGRAAAAGYAPAQHAYATFLWADPGKADNDGLRAPERTSGRDLEGAMLWAERAAEAGLPEAQALLGQIFCFGPPTVRDETRGEALLLQAAAAGRAEAYLGLGLLRSRHADDLPQIADEARQCFNRAAEGGSPYALFALGVMAERAATDIASWHLAADFYAEAAKLGHRGAQARWGILLAEGVSGPPKPIQGESWVRKAALAGEKDAAAWLGDRYAQPQGALPPNVLEASAWYHRAAALGHGRAAWRLGSLYSDGRLGRDAQHAAALFQQAAQLGETGALADLQALAAEGAVPIAVMTDTIEASPAGQYWYGRFLLRQAETPEVLAAARHWIARAAEGGVIRS